MGINLVVCTLKDDAHYNSETWIIRQCSIVSSDALRTALFDDVMAASQWLVFGDIWELIKSVKVIYVTVSVML